MKAPVATSAAPLMEKAESTSPVEPDVLVAPFFSVIAALDNKKKYLVARAEKLRKFDEDAKYGKKLTEDKEKARLCLPDVKNQIGFIDTIQKKVMEKQREFNKKTKQRNYAAKQENDQICGKVAIEALTARYLLGQYLGAGEESQLLKSFNTDDRVNLKSVARFFLPEKFPSPPVTRFSAIIEKHKTEIDTILSRKTNYYLWDDFNGNDAYRLLEKLAKVLENLEEERVSGQKVDRLGSNNINDEAETPVSSSPAEPDFKAPAPSNTPVELVYAPDDPKPLKSGDGKITFGYFSDSSRQSTPPSAPLVTQRAADTNAEKPVVADGEKPEAGEKTERKRPPRRPRSQRKSKTSEGVDPAFENGTVAVPKPKTERPPKLDKDGEKTSAAPRSKGAPRGGKYNNGQRRTNGPRENRENGTGHKQAYFAENGTRAPRKAYNDENETRAPRYNKNYQETSIDQKTGYYKAHNNREHARESYYRNEYTVPEGYVRRGDYVRPLDSSTCGFTLKVQQ